MATGRIGDSCFELIGSESSPGDIMGATTVSIATTGGAGLLTGDPEVISSPVGLVPRNALRVINYYLRNADFPVPVPPDEDLMVLAYWPVAIVETAAGLENREL